MSAGEKGFRRKSFKADGDGVIMGVYGDGRENE